MDFEKAGVFFTVTYKEKAGLDLDVEISGVRTGMSARESHYTMKSIV